MRRALFALLLVATPAVAADDKFTPLFNGKDTTGWTFTLRPPADKPDAKPDPKDTWSVKDGVLLCTGKPNGYIATTKEYENYTLKLKWRFPKDAKGGNSGVLLHCVGDDKVWPNSIEAQLKAGFAGDLWLNADKDGKLPKLELPGEQKDAANKEGRHFFRLNKDDKVEKEFGEWNEYEITCKGGDITLVVNGKTANKATGGQLKKGRIALQSEGAPIEFKEIEIKAARRTAGVNPWVLETQAAHAAGSPGEFQHLPQARVVAEREVGGRAQRLVAVFAIPHVVKHAQPRVLLRVEARQHRRREERFEPIAALQRVMPKRDVGRAAQRGVLQGTVDLRLPCGRFVFVASTARRKQVELVAVPAGPVAAAGVAGVDPHAHAVGRAGLVGVALRRFLFAGHAHLHGEAELVPRQAHVGEPAGRVEFGEVVQRRRVGQVEQVFGVGVGRDALRVQARMGEADKKAVRDERVHGGGSVPGGDTT